MVVVKIHSARAGRSVHAFETKSIMSTDSLRQPSFQPPKARRCWITRPRVLVMALIAVTSLAIWSWTRGPQPSLIEELRASALAEGLEIIDLDDRSDQLAPPLPCLTMAELGDLAAEGELMLYTMRGKGVTWHDMTGVPFAESVRAAQELDRSLSEDDQRLLLGYARTLRPSVIGEAPRATTCGEMRLNSCIIAMICQGWADEAGKRFLADHGIDLGRRIDREAAEEAMDLSLKYWHEFRRCVREARKQPDQAADIRTNSPLIARHFTEQHWLRAIQGSGDEQEKKRHDLRENLERVLPIDWPSSREAARWYRLGWEQCFHEIAVRDYLAEHPEIFGPLSEEQVGARDYVMFEFHKPSERYVVEALLESFRNADGTINHTRADNHYKLRQAVSLRLFFNTGRRLNTKSIHTEIRPRFGYKGAKPTFGRLAFQLPTDQNPDHYAFVYYGDKVVRPRDSDHNAFLNSSVASTGQNAMAEECRQKLADDFVAHRRFRLDPVLLQRAFTAGNGSPATSYVIERPFVKRTPMEQDLLDRAWTTLSKQFSSTLDSWDEFEQLWKVERFGPAILLLQDRVEKSALEDKGELVQIILRTAVYHLPSVEMAPKPKASPQ